MTGTVRGAMGLLLAVAALGSGACSRGQDDVAAVASGGGLTWETVRDQFIDEYLQAHPVFAVVSGRHEFDGMLPDWSAAGFAAERTRLHAARDRAMEFGDEALTAAQRFERDYLVARIDRDLFWIETAEAPFRNPAFYLDWMVDNLDPSPYLTRDYAPLDTRLLAYATYARAVPRATAQIRENLRLPLARPLLERGVSAFRGFAEFYERDVPGIFESVPEPGLQAELAEANAGAAQAMRELSEWLESQRDTATADFALGAETFAAMLRATERVSTPLAELQAAGVADLERNQQALRQACATFVPGFTIPDCIARAEDNKPQGGSVAAARAQLVRLQRFVEAAGVATIPERRQALVAEAPPYNRANFAYIDIPGPFEEGTSAVYYIAPPDPSWTGSEQRAYLPGVGNLLFTSVHEVWPGHFLQFLHARRVPSMVGRLFVGYGFAEGWAHYAEEMAWEMGLEEGSAEMHVGQLSNALMRNVRFLSAIGLHTGGMSLEDAERTFLDQAYTDPGTARQQAARGTYDPAYLNYTMGKLLIRKLREDWTAARGGRDAWRAFHDEFLSFGGPPIPLVREAMLGGAAGALFSTGGPRNVP